MSKKTKLKGKTKVELNIPNPSDVYCGVDYNSKGVTGTLDLDDLDPLTLLPKSNPFPVTINATAGWTKSGGGFFGGFKEDETVIELTKSEQKEMDELTQQKDELERKIRHENVMETFRTISEEDKEKAMMAIGRAAAITSQMMALAAAVQSGMCQPPIAIDREKLSEKFRKATTGEDK